MDLSLRTYLAGYKALFLEDVPCSSELPSSLYAFRKQQHRWTTGPMQLLLKALPEIVQSPLPMRRKVELVVCFFAVGKATTHVVCLLFYCMLLPLSVFTPELQVRPLWAFAHKHLCKVSCVSSTSTHVFCISCISSTSTPTHRRASPCGRYCMCQ